MFCLLDMVRRELSRARPTMLDTSYPASVTWASGMSGLLSWDVELALAPRHGASPVQTQGRSWYTPNKLYGPVKTGPPILLHLD
jgi:hypothetical protein